MTDDDVYIVALLAEYPSMLLFEGGDRFDVVFAFWSGFASGKYPDAEVKAINDYLLDECLRRIGRECSLGIGGMILLLCDQSRERALELFRDLLEDATAVVKGVSLAEIFASKHPARRSRRQRD